MSDNGMKVAALQCIDTAVKNLNEVGSLAQAFEKENDKGEMIGKMSDVMQQLDLLATLSDAYKGVFVPEALYEDMNKVPPEHPGYEEGFLGKLAHEVCIKDQQLHLFRKEMNKMQEDIRMGRE